MDKICAQTKRYLWNSLPHGTIIEKVSPLPKSQKSNYVWKKINYRSLCNIEFNWFILEMVNYQVKKNFDCNKSLI